MCHHWTEFAVLGCAMPQFVEFLVRLPTHFRRLTMCSPLPEYRYLLQEGGGLLSAMDYFKPVGLRDLSTLYSYHSAVYLLPCPSSTSVGAAHIFGGMCLPSIRVALADHHHP
jgi:hypothetical protein